MYFCYCTVHRDQIKYSTLFVFHFPWKCQIKWCGMNEWRIIRIAILNIYELAHKFNEFVRNIAYSIFLFSFIMLFEASLLVAMPMITIIFVCETLFVRYYIFLLLYQYQSNNMKTFVSLTEWQFTYLLHTYNNTMHLSTIKKNNKEQIYEHEFMFQDNRGKHCFRTFNICLTFQYFYRFGVDIVRLSFIVYSGC